MKLKHAAFSIKQLQQNLSRSNYKTAIVFSLPFIYTRNWHHFVSISLSSDGKLHYKTVMTRYSLCHVQLGLSIYFSESPIYVTLITLSEITTILFKNFNVLKKNHNNNLLFCDTYSNSRSSIFFSPFPPSPLPIPKVFGESTWSRD